MPLPMLGARKECLISLAHVDPPVPATLSMSRSSRMRGATPTVAVEFRKRMGVPSRLTGGGFRRIHGNTYQVSFQNIGLLSEA